MEVQGVWVAFVARGVRFERFGSSSSSPSWGVRVRGVWVIVRLARFGSEGFESSSLRGFWVVVVAGGWQRLKVAEGIKLRCNVGEGGDGEREAEGSGV